MEKEICKDLDAYYVGSAVESGGVVRVIDKLGEKVNVLNDLPYETALKIIRQAQNYASHESSRYSFYIIEQETEVSENEESDDAVR